MWWIYKSAVKRNELLIQATTWMGLKIIMLSKRSQKKRSICYTMTCIENSRSTQVYDDTKQRNGCLWYREWQEGDNTKGWARGNEVKDVFLSWLWGWFLACIRLPKFVKLHTLNICTLSSVHKAVERNLKPRRGALAPLSVLPLCSAVYSGCQVQSAPNHPSLLL